MYQDCSSPISVENFWKEWEMIYGMMIDYENHEDV